VVFQLIFHCGRRTPGRAFLPSLALSMCLCFAVVGRAQVPDGGVANGQPELTPPQVLEPSQAVYPPDALAQRLAGAVELTLMIAVDGTVLSAEIVQPIGHGFDEAALEAVRRFRFTPARRNGEPIAARIRYRYVFEPPPEPVLAPLPTTGSLSGKLLTEHDGTPIVRAQISVTASDGGETYHLETDAAGAFALEDLAPGSYRVEVKAGEFLDLAHLETVQAGEQTGLSYRMRSVGPGEDSDEYGARAVIAAPPREVTRRTVSRELMYRIPGTGNDPIRSVEVLPGVSRPPFGSGQLIVRGSAPADSQVIVDGVPIPQLYHFGGLRSVYNGQMLRQVSLFPGNFSSRFGRKSGGIFELETRDPQADRLHGVLDLSPIDTSVLLEGPITKRFAVAASVRRSVFDLALRALSSGESNSSFTAVPSYYDYQFIGAWRPSSRDLIRLQFYGSNDRLGLLDVNETEANAVAAANAVNLTSRFNLFQASWRRQVGKRTDQYMTVQAGPTSTDAGVGTQFRLELHNIQVYARAEWLTRIAENVRLVSGIDVNTGTYSARYKGPSIGQSEGNPNENPDDQIGVKASGSILQPGVYADLAVDLGPVTLNAAVRGDYYDEIRNYSIDPRFLLEWRIHPRWTWKAGAGLYSQPPQLQESNRSIGNIHLDPIRTAHFSSSLYWMPTDGLKFGLEGFYKLIWDNVTAGQDANDPAYTNDGQGRIYGGEVSAEVHPKDSHFTGILSYTLLSSERQDHVGLAWRSFDYEQTHGLTVALLYQLPRNWEVGAALRYYTGNPYTPITGRVYNATDRSYQQLLGQVNSARNPAFNRVDFRIQKTWQGRRNTITLYLDVQNLLNHKNQEAVFYNYDYTRQGVVNGLPIIPAIGVRGQF
jgi:TonB family protein